MNKCPKECPYYFKVTEESMRKAIFEYYNKADKSKWYKRIYADFWLGWMLIQLKFMRL